MKIFLKFIGTFILILVCVLTLSFCTESGQKDSTEKDESKAEATDSYTDTTDTIDTSHNSEETNGGNGVESNGESDTASEQTNPKPNIRLGSEADATWDTYISAD